MYRQLPDRRTGSADRISAAKQGAEAHCWLSKDVFAAFHSPDMIYSSPL
jgi:hypothetical protein